VAIAITLLVMDDVLPVQMFRWLSQNDKIKSGEQYIYNAWHMKKLHFDRVKLFNLALYFDHEPSKLFADYQLDANGRPVDSLKALYSRFGEFIWSNFHINLDKYATASRLAMVLYMENHFR
jgi:hypothetical protein